MPTNIVPRSIPITVSVVRALRQPGGLNAGTPSLIASTPVSAVQPDAKALRMSSIPTPSMAWPSGAVWTGSVVWVASRMNPTMSITKMPKMNR